MSTVQERPLPHPPLSPFWPPGPPALLYMAQPEPCTLRPPFHPSLPPPPSVCRSAPSHYSHLCRQGNHRSPSCTAGTGPPSLDQHLPSLRCHFCQDRHPGQDHPPVPGIGFCVA